MITLCRNLRAHNGVHGVYTRLHGKRQGAPFARAKSGSLATNPWCFLLVQYFITNLCQNACRSSGIQEFPDLFDNFQSQVF